jgi:sec-independent protein translocase protein TatA
VFNSPTDWLIIAGVVVVLFGGRKLPEMGKGLGEGIKEFKKAVQGGGHTDEEKKEETPGETTKPS